MRAKEPDEWLMAQVARGERGPLETLIRRYASPLLTFIQRMRGDLHRSEELFQEVFIAVWNARKQYEFPRTFKSWLFAIALNKCRADFRNVSPAKNPIVSTELPNTAMTSEPSPLETMIVSETTQAVSKAITQLPAQQRSVVVLRVYQEMSYAEIADAMELSEGTVRSHMHHALAALRQQLNNVLT